MIEVLTRLRLPIAPVEPDEVARKADLDALAGGMIGFFWIDQENGNLYFISDEGVRNPFQLENGNLYYVMPEVA